MKLSKSQTKWFAYDRELLAIYSSIKKFQHMLEDREFTIYTYQKPLTQAFKQKPDLVNLDIWNLFHNRY